MGGVIFGFDPMRNKIMQALMTPTKLTPPSTNAMMANARLADRGSAANYSPQSTRQLGAAKVVGSGKGWTEVQGYDGQVIRREGARNWRNNNPGNLEYGDAAKKFGAIGSDGRFAVFPTYEAGRKAKERLLFETPKYQNRTIASAITRYAPPKENNTQSYIAAVSKAAGADQQTPLMSLSPEQRVAMLDAMQKVEGFRPGMESLPLARPLPTEIDAFGNSPRNKFGRLMQEFY